MPCPTLLVLLPALLALAAPVVARPPLRTVDLADDAMNRTVCPISVSVDEDPSRVPRRIKLLKCAPDPNQWCTAQRIPPHECCAHSHNHHVMECVEIHDTVLVKYKNSNKTKMYDVAVGCTCMIERSRPADTPT